MNKSVNAKCNDFFNYYFLKIKLILQNVHAGLFNNPKDKSSKIIDLCEEYTSKILVIIIIMDKIII